MTLVYLASPYSHPDADKRHERFRLACQASVELIRDGFHVFSPIAHTHPIALEGELPLEWDYWEAYDQRMIAACDELHVLRLEGWKESKGIAAEIKIAERMGKPIVHHSLSEDGLVVVQRG